MDDKEKKATQPEAPVTNPEETQETEQHAEEVDATTQPTSEAHVEEKESGESQPDSTEEDFKTKYERLREKQSGIEKDKNELSQKAKVLEALDRAASRNPEFKKLANKMLVEEGLLSPDEVEDIETPQTENKSHGEDSDPAIKWARDQYNAEQKKIEKFFTDFEDKHPDLSEGSREVVKTNRQAITAVAVKKMTEGASQEEAYEFAYKVIMNPSKLIEEGKIEGLAQAQSARPAESSASGGNAKSSGTVTLTPEQKDAARRFGISEEEYAKNLEE